MKIKRQELIKIIEQRLAGAEKFRHDQHEKLVTKYDEALAEYTVRTHDAWLDFARAVFKRVEQHGVVVADDIPRPIRAGGLGGGGLRLFDDRPPRKRNDITPEERLLRTLLEVLKQTTDETVSTHALEKMGFPLGRVLR